MKKSYLWGAFAVMALASCSQDEVVNIPQSEIKYSVVANKASRADDVFCNNNYPDIFYSSAYFNAGNDTENPSGTYFVKDKLVKGNIVGQYVNETAKRYWPQLGSLDVYAYNEDDKTKTASVEFNWPDNPAATTPTIDFKVAEDVEDQFDLLYAVKKGATVGEGNVSLNFRHALSQIVFQARNENPYIHVVVKEVSIKNVIGEGIFTYPNTTTVDNVVDHTQNGITDQVPGDNVIFIANQGEWSNYGAATAGYTANFDDVVLDELDKTYNLTNNVIYQKQGEDVKEFEGENLSMLLMPQKLKAYLPNNAAITENSEGSYFLLDCDIYNIADVKGKYDAATDVKLYSGPIAIPVAGVWMQGHKYVYTFVFTKEGNGGIDPDDGDPVLVPIVYNVTVDDFTNETETEVDMDSGTIVITEQADPVQGN